MLSRVMAAVNGALSDAGRPLLTEEQALPLSVYRALCVRSASALRPSALCALCALSVRSVSAPYPQLLFAIPLCA